MDLDGPSVAWGSGGLQMVINVQPGDATTIDIWLAQRLSLSRLVWEATPLAEVNTDGVEDNDPAISADGRVLVFSRIDEDLSELLVATRAAVDQPFSAPVLLSELNSTAIDNGPTLFSRSDGQLEIFFVSNRSDAVLQIYQARCSLTAQP